MRRPGAVVLQFLMAATVAMAAGCATRGHVYERAVTDTFVIGQTTPTQAVAALGKPTFDLRRPDGLRIMRWEYQRLRGIVITRHVVGANFGPSGVLVYLHNPQRPEVVDPF